ncbi:MULTISPECIES: hypothetical protein [Marinomonas]|jgi:hypothetical protein|uniref:hypothetical protein n=3 Tax=Oceanospirillaceae TaxID=135620 RepID=UPI001054F7BA|nr:hypothetical protein [Marinomonas sp. KMM3893]
MSFTAYIMGLLMQMKKLLLPMLALVLSTNLYASNSAQYNDRLIQDRAQLKQLVMQLKQLGVHVESTVQPGALTSKMEEHAVLQAKIVHFQKKLREVMNAPHIACIE